MKLGDYKFIFVDVALVGVLFMQYDDSCIVSQFLFLYKTLKNCFIR